MVTVTAVVSNVVSVWVTEAYLDQESPLDVDRSIMVSHTEPMPAAVANSDVDAT